MASQNSSDSPPPPPPPPRRDWGDLGAAVADRLGLVTYRSPTLRDMIQHGSRYMDVSSKQRQLVFDTRAGFIGLLLTAQNDPQRLQYETSATWFYDWLSERVGSIDSFVARARSSPEEVLRSFRDGFEARLSASMIEMRRLAEGISQATQRSALFEARHFLGAMVMHGGVTKIAMQLFKLDLSAEALADFKLNFIENVLRTGNGIETRESWHRALGLPPPTTIDVTLTATGTVRTPTDGMEVVFADRIDLTRDTLNTTDDARALARVLCLYDAAPLALAVFGAWGSGKSTFMARLDAEIKKLARGVVEDSTTLKDAPAGTARFINRVVQIKFNAWQFADANLWASLTAEFFDQLRAGGWERVGDARHSQLVEQVGRHVHSLNDDLNRKREAASQSGKMLRDAQQARDKAAADLKEGGAKVLTQSGLDLLGDIYEAEKPRLSALGLAVAGDDTGKAADVVIAAVAKSRSIVDQIGAIAKVAGKTKERTWFAIVLIVVLAFVVAAALVWGRGMAGDLPAQIAAGLAAVSAMGAAANWLKPILSLVSSVTKKGADIATAVEAADDKNTRKLLKSELKLREAAAEAKALKDAADEAQQRLSRYVDPNGSSNPPRLLRYVLEDDPNTKALQAEVGLIGRTRRLFEAVNDIIAKDRGAREEARKKGISLPEDSGVPDRIILYIDDLDRCNERQVYNVLQAIHLLLAFPAFVVVVGVDVDWVHGALAQSIARKGDSREAKVQRASRYLEKIFQIAFWLRPLSSEKDGSFSDYVRSLAEAAGGYEGGVAPVGGAAGAETKTQGGIVLGPGPGVAPLGFDQAGGASPPPPPAGPPEPPPVQLLKAIQLERVEVEFLSHPDIARIAATTPRAVKRLMNVYRIVRARLSDAGEVITGSDPGKALYPLIALSAAIETGQSASGANGFHAALSKFGSNDRIAIFADEEYMKTDPAKAGSFERALRDAPAIRKGLAAALDLRGQQITAGELLSILRLTRRYSFNHDEPKAT